MKTFENVQASARPCGKCIGIPICVECRRYGLWVINNIQAGRGIELSPDVAIGIPIIINRHFETGHWGPELQAYIQAGRI